MPNKNNDLVKATVQDIVRDCENIMFPEHKAKSRNCDPMLKEPFEVNLGQLGGLINIARRPESNIVQLDGQYKSLLKKSTKNYVSKLNFYEWGIYEQLIWTDNNSFGEKVFIRINQNRN